jgi:hypothetical protein
MKGAAAVFDADGVRIISLRKRMGLGWAASANANLCQGNSRGE